MRPEGGVSPADVPPPELEAVRARRDAKGLEPLEVPAAEGPEPEGPEPEPEPSAVDTHCHLFLIEEEEDPAEVVASAREAGVGRLVCVGIDPESSRRSASMAESFRGVFATAGMHPHTAADLDGRAGAELEELLADPMVIGVGETGLDYYRRLSPVEDQQRAFRVHIALSRETGKPLIVHVREAWEDALAILGAERADRVVLHCFSGDEAIAREADARGYFVSFAGNVTYPKAEGIRRAAAALDGSRLLAETDSPFLPPQSQRGKSNRPVNVLTVLQELSNLRGASPAQLVAETTANARSAFPLLL